MRLHDDLKEKFNTKTFSLKYRKIKNCERFFLPLLQLHIIVPILSRIHISLSYLTYHSNPPELYLHKS